VYDKAGCFIIHNNSESVIYVCSSCSDSLLSGHNLTYYSNYNKSDSLKYPNYRIEKDSLGCIAFSGRKEHIAKKCKDKKLRFFFINESVMKENTWAEICKYQLFEKKITLSEEDLKKMNWCVIYE
jgi:hypothetical protein